MICCCAAKKTLQFLRTRARDTDVVGSPVTLHGGIPAAGRETSCSRTVLPLRGDDSGTALVSSWWWCPSLRSSMDVHLTPARTQARRDDWVLRSEAIPIDCVRERLWEAVLQSQGSATASGGGSGWVWLSLWGQALHWDVQVPSSVMNQWMPCKWLAWHYGLLDFFLCSFSVTVCLFLCCILSSVYYIMVYCRCDWWNSSGSSLTGAVAWRSSVCGLRLATLPTVLCDLNNRNLVDIKQ